MKRGAIDYSDIELALIESLQGLPRALIHAEFREVFQRDDVSEGHIKALCTRNGWTTRAQFSGHDDQVLRERYPHISTARLARELKRSTSAVYQRAYKLGLQKSEAYLASPDACRLRRGDNVGVASRFKKGQTPANKGVKRPGWAPGRMRDTQFTKGQKGWNWKPVGSVRTIDGYQYTKVSDVRRVPYTVNWKATHILQWEALHGPVPEGHALKSVDGNRLNIDPANWTLISRSVLPRLNGGRLGRIGYDKAPSELKPTIMAVSQLEHAVRRQKRRAA